MFTATIKSLNESRLAGLAFSGAPSLTAAIRADAERLVNLCAANGDSGYEGCLVKYVLGEVEADVVKVSVSTYHVTFYNKDDIFNFAIVEVK